MKHFGKKLLIAMVEQAVGTLAHHLGKGIREHLERKYFTKYPPTQPSQPTSSNPQPK